MEDTSRSMKGLASYGILFLCFGYFASYVPYSMMAKMASSGLFSGMEKGFAGLEIQPVAVAAGLIAMYSYIFYKGWWKYATHFNFMGMSLPRPRTITFFSGLCTASQIITTTMAYTFTGVSIVFAMLLMRGGVLILAPIVDMAATKRKRRIYWPSWVAAGLSFIAVLSAFSSKAGTALTIACTIDIILYLVGYFFRLFLMSNYAKTTDLKEKLGYFVEEQIVAMPMLLLVMFIIALTGMGADRTTAAGQLWYGFTALPFSGYVGMIALLGLFSQGTGLFGTLIYLDPRENTFTVPANRSSSVVAGVVASYLLAIFYGMKYPSGEQLFGVALILGAIFFLAYRSTVEKRAKANKFSPPPSSSPINLAAENE